MVCYLVDGGTADRVRETSIERRLSRRCLSDSSGEDVAEDDFLDIARGDVYWGQRERGRLSRATPQDKAGRHDDRHAAPTSQQKLAALSRNSSDCSVVQHADLLFRRPWKWQSRRAL